MVAEYIDRGTAIAKLTALEVTEPNATMVDAKRVLADTPAADVAPVLHGRWILEREPNGKPYCFHCSVCDSDYHYIGIMAVSDYCPNCGAKMDGEAEELPHE